MVFLIQAQDDVHDICGIVGFSFYGPIFKKEVQISKKKNLKLAIPTKSVTSLWKYVTKIKECSYYRRFYVK